MAPRHLRNVALLILLLGVLSVTAVLGTSDARTVTVAQDGSGDHDTIGSALSAAEAGDTVLVRGGTYRESFFICPGVSLVGEGRETTLVEGNGSEAVLVHSSANMSGFTVSNPGGTGLKMRGDNNRVSSNTFRDCRYGINMEDSQYNVFTGNLFLNDTTGLYTIRGTLPYDEKDYDHNEISGNTFRDSATGLYLHGTKTRAYTVVENEFVGCEVGLLSDKAYKNTITDNTFTNNTESGLKFYDLDMRGNVVSRNSFHCNRYGIHASHSGWLTVDNCTFLFNTVGWFQQGKANRNVIRDNVFFGNEQEGMNATGGYGWAGREVVVIASGNWWGATSGPFHPVSNPGGTGDAVSDKVTFEPWLDGAPFTFAPFIDVRVLGGPVEGEEGQMAFDAVAFGPVPIAAYVWTSSVDGELHRGPAGAFVAEGLTMGEHVIGLKVQDSEGWWSAERRMPLYCHRRPTAVVDAAPAVVNATCAAVFAGHGTDDGEVAGCCWTSDVDGFLNDSFEFTTDAMSLGRHNVTFWVVDDRGAASDGVTLAVEVRQWVIERPEWSVGDRWRWHLWTIMDGESVDMEVVEEVDGVQVFYEGRDCYKLNYTICSEDEYHRGSVWVTMDDFRLVGHSIDGFEGTDVPIGSFTFLTRLDLPVAVHEGNLLFQCDPAANWTLGERAYDAYRFRTSGGEIVMVHSPGAKNLVNVVFQTGDGTITFEMMAAMDPEACYDPAVVRDPEGEDGDGSGGDSPGAGTLAVALSMAMAAMLTRTRKGSSMEKRGTKGR